MLYQNGGVTQLDPWTLRQQSAGISEYERANDLIRAGWGVGETPEDVMYAVKGYSGDNALHYGRNGEGNQQVWFYLSGKAEKNSGTLTMTLDKSSEMVISLELASGQSNG